MLDKTICVQFFVDANKRSSLKGLATFWNICFIVKKGG